MSEELLIQHCSPTLAGLKTANLFRCEYETEEELRVFLRMTNNRLSPKGIRAMPLRYGNGMALIYVFRPGHLEEDLTSDEARKLLEENGYFHCCENSCDNPCGGLGRCLARLAMRLNEGKDFPHEIGIFLGYPPEDVRGFMDRKPCKCVGTWKVYGDEKSAKEKFARFKKCSEIYCKLHMEGRPVEKLAVAQF